MAIAGFKGMSDAVTKLVKAGGNPNAVNNKGRNLFGIIFLKFQLLWTLVMSA